MDKNISYKKYFKIAFIINIVGIVLSFVFKGNLGVFGTLLIIIAIVLAIIGFIKKKKQEN